MATITNDILRKVANIIGGVEAVEVAMALKELEEATSDQILLFYQKLAKILPKPEMKLNDIRRTLFKLYNHSLVQCDRSRDANTGWFIFRWRLQLDQVEGFLNNQKKRILRILKVRLEYEENNEFYHCYTPECSRMIFEDVVELVFRCPVCSKALQYFDNSEWVKALKHKIEQLEKEET